MTLSTLCQSLLGTSVSRCAHPDLKPGSTTLSQLVCRSPMAAALPKRRPCPADSSAEAQGAASYGGFALGRDCGELGWSFPRGVGRPPTLTCGLRPHLSEPTHRPRQATGATASVAEPPAGLPARLSTERGTGDQASFSSGRSTSASPTRSRPSSTARTTCSPISRPQSTKKL